MYFIEIQHEVFASRGDSEKNSEFQMVFEPKTDVGSNTIWNSEFFSESPLDAKTSSLYFYKRLTWWLDGCISDMP